MHLIRLANIIFVVAFLFHVEVSAKPLQKEPIDPTFTEDKQAIVITKDDPRFILKLKSNPTTGYSWFLREYNSNLIEPIKHGTETPANKKLMGAPGYELWTFRMKPAGFIVPQQTTVRFVYARPWETADNSTQVMFKVSTQGVSK